ncbi:trypsin-like peptidase domain-containing protein [Salibaculum halophilum]|uniref:trypsin-like peptidase domain-containing protein n=1 Tax=Salibaculum halophilum TaxID=1914408 RepID=UPI001FE58241|nr:trypsin-like peptidase domain-containing protein [Salibaculum halophilum]
MRRMTSGLFAIVLAVAVSGLAAGSAAAQQRAWVQIEAQRTLTDAQESARGYAAAGIDDVNGFLLGSGWYGIALGPYTEGEARSVRRTLRARGLIPADSYLVDGSRFGQRYWPAGVTGAAAAPENAPQAEPAAPDPIAIPDETVAEARAAERRLTRADKRELQEMLQWAGHYTGPIDGLFGGGTRRAMAAWQEANNHEVTGVMTTGQRAELLAAYNAILDGLDMATVRDETAGIEMTMPTGVVAFEGYEPPFARYDATGDLDAQVLLISQPGDRTRMFGLYEIMQTLEIVPREGPRERTAQGFTIEGIGEEIHSFTSVSLDDGRIKGFTLVWPAGDADRRARVLDEMRASFARTDGVLDPAIAPPDDDQAIDLVSGLQVRRPLRDRSGFYVNEGGDVLTTTEAVEGCGSITLAKAHEARPVHRDDALGLAVLRPEDALAPPQVADFNVGVPRLQADVAVAGFPYGGVLATPALTFGTLADIRGLEGEDTVKRLSLAAEEGDAGGPVFDDGGAVLGMLLPRRPENGRVLPPDVSFSVHADQIVASLDAAGVPVQTTDVEASMSPAALTQMAADVAVLVSCWEN